MAYLSCQVSGHPLRLELEHCHVLVHAQDDSHHRMCGLDHFDLVLVHEQVLMVVLECEWGSDHRHVVLVLDRDHAIGGPVVPMFGQGSGLHHGFAVPIGGKDYCHFRVHGEWLVPTRSQIHLMSALAPS